MTPLANRVLGLLHSDPEFRSKFAHLLAPFPDLRCFDMSEVSEAVEALAEEIKAKNVKGDMRVFLPAPAVWIEDRSRFCPGGWILHQQDPEFAKSESFMWYNDDDGYRHFGLMPEPDLFLREASDAEMRTAEIEGIYDGLWTAPEPPMAAYRLQAALAIINTPRIFRQERRRENWTGQRKLKALLPPGSRIPTAEWTEIKLEITPPEAGESSGERLTGKKALHYCRAHLRVVNGKIVPVTGHWRGDAALGVRQGRYTVT